MQGHLNVWALLVSIKHYNYNGIQKINDDTEEALRAMCRRLKGNTRNFFDSDPLYETGNEAWSWVQAVLDYCSGF